MAFDLVAAYAQADTPFFVTGQSAQPLSEAPQQITLRFSAGAKIDADTLAAITVQRAGGDGVFGNAGDVTLTPANGVGIVTVDDFPNQNQVVLRFAENLPDDLYRITIGGGLQTEAGDSFRGGAALSFNVRLDLGAQVVSVVPQPITRGAGNALQHSLNTIDVYFNANDPLQAESAQNPRNYRLVETDPTTGADVAVQIPQAVSYNAATGKATLTFAADLGDKLYRLQVGGSDDANATIATAVVVGTVFQQAPSTTPAYTTNSFLGDGATGLNDVDLYKVALAAPGTLTVRITPAAGFTPALRLFDAAGAAIVAGVDVSEPGVLTYAAPSAGTLYVGVSSTGNTAYDAVSGAGAAGGTSRGGYRLQIFSTAQMPLPEGDSSFGTANRLGTLGAAGQSVSATILPRPMPTPVGSLGFPSPPGTIDEPGHREIPLPLETHLMPAATVNGASTARVVTYNFPTVYGFDPQGNALVNAITENQKQRTREIVELYSRATGIRFVETLGPAELGVVTGDVRAVDPTLPEGAVSGICGVGAFGKLAVMTSTQNWGNSEYNGQWQSVAMHEIGHSLGLGHSYDVPSNMGGESPDVLPGDYDLVHLTVLNPAFGNDIDVYSFELDKKGTLSAETFVARPGQPVASLLDSVLTLYREETVDGRPVRTMIARNDDFNGRDSFIGLELDATAQSGAKYTYYLAVTSVGNTAFDPEVENSGANGRSDGAYRLQLSFTPAGETSNTIVDATGTPLDGDRDGLAGGAFNFWFRSSTAANTVYVDKLAPGAGATGSRTNPFNTISAGLAAAAPGSGKSIVRIVGNSAGAAATPYLVGTNLAGTQPLEDGATFVVPAGVTVMIDEGAVFKFRRQVIDVGSSSQLVSRAGAALQVLGTPGNKVQFTSFHDDTIGGSSDGQGPAVTGGQWGGIIFRQDSDSATRRVFLNSVSQADIRYGGGQVTIDSQLQSIAPLHLETSRPTIAFNDVRNSAGAAISADPNSFEESAGRAGPAIRGNIVRDNSVNGVQLRIRTEFGQPIDRLTVPARFASPDITYVIPENLFIAGGVGGYDATSGVVRARSSGRLTVDPGVVVKLQRSRIELERGNSQLYAEGTPQKRVIFTSTLDNRFGAGGTFVVGAAATAPAAGDWGGIVVNDGAAASIDNASISFGGGQAPVPGGFASFNTLSVDQGSLRLANSRFESNATGIYVIGAQPVIIGNDFRGNAGDLISIDANSLNSREVPDPGRSTGLAARYSQYDGNRGPLVRGNRVTAGGVTGMTVRGGEITVESVWDDTDIVHVVRSEIVVSNFHTATGLRLMSSPNASLVVKLRGASAGLTATGERIDIDDRIGGTVQVIGQPGYPVILTSLADDTVGASLDPVGRTVTDTNGDGTSSLPVSGEWRGLRFLPYSNDRNVSVLRESELAVTGGVDVNATTDSPQVVGVLAPNEAGGDDNRRLGFDIHGAIAYDDPTDVDIYSFTGYVGSEVWIDVDYTSASLDSMIELLDAAGTVLARSADVQTDHPGLSAATLGLALPFQEDVDLGPDLLSTNPRDPAIRLVLPGATVGATAQYFVRVRSQPRSSPTESRADYESRLRNDADPAQPGVQLAPGATSGSYDLRIRLRQTDDKPGSTVRYADIRYPLVGVDVQGLPQRSPLTGETGESSQPNETKATAQYVGNVLQTDLNTISLSGRLDSAGDIDWYSFDVNYEGIQAIGGVNGGAKTFAAVFDIDYANGIRGDLTLSVFDSQGRLMFVGRDSNVAADQPPSAFEDTSRGSLGKLDPFIGPVHLPAGLPGGTQRYYVAVSSNERLPSVLDWFKLRSATDPLVRIEPVNSVVRVVEDRIGLNGYHSGMKYFGFDNGFTYDFRDYTFVAPSGGPLFVLPTLADQVSPVALDNIQTYVSVRTGPAGDGLIIADDLAMRSDGRLYSYRGIIDGVNTAGELTGVSIGVTKAETVWRDNIRNFPDKVAPTEFTDNSASGTTPTTVATVTTFVLDAQGDVQGTVELSTVQGTLQYTTTLPGNPLPSTGTWTFTSNASGVLTFTAVGGIPANMPLPSPTGCSVNAEGVLSVNWVDGGAGATVVVSGVSMTDVQYTFNPVIPPETVTTDRVDAVVWRRQAGSAAAVYDRLFYSVRDVDPLTNEETGVSRLYRANPATGDANDADGTNPDLGRIGIIQTAGTNVLGLTTGMAYVGPTLYGVDSLGHLFTINPDTAVATLVGQLQYDGQPVNLQGLANGPQNVPGGPENTPGYFADKLFAIDADGYLYCIDPSAAPGELAPLPVFLGDDPTRKFVGPVDEDGNGAASGQVTGFAFSPIDIPLWRATNVRGTDPGHGVTPSLDNTRDGLFDNDTKDQPTERVGHTSIYYGLDNTKSKALDGTTLTPLGLVSTTWLTDLTNTTTGVGTSVANLPAPRAFSLSLAATTVMGSSIVTVPSTSGLRPGMDVSGDGILSGTFIESIIDETTITLSSRAIADSVPGEATLSFTSPLGITTLPFSLAGSTYTDKPTLYFNYRIEAADKTTSVQLSANDGNWITIATNDHARSKLDRADETLPNFAAVSSRISLQPNQLVQELFEGAGWRQARIDLGEFAGLDNIRLRLNFEGRGTGAYEGVYFDDFVIGFAERGEMITGHSGGNTDFFTVGTPGPSFTVPAQNLSGAYQLEIRRGMEFGELTSRLSSAVQILGDSTQFFEPVNVIGTNASLVGGVLHPAATSPFNGYGGVTQRQNLRGDENTRRGQGQFIIEGNVISDAGQYGIRVDAAARDAETGASTMGAVKSTPNLNTKRLVPGVVIVNNVVTKTQGSAAILFSGDPNSGTGPLAPVPYGRIVNNTIHGGTAGVQVTENASPTLLNNVFANLATGITVDATSSGTVVGYSAFHATATPGVQGTNAVFLPTSPFVNAARGNFYPSAKSPIIDSGLASLEDRDDYTSITQPVGIPLSPIIAPGRDLYGQLRSDDPDQGPGFGQGGDVFKDRGAVDRVDFVQPSASLAIPLDGSATDQNGDPDHVRLVKVDARGIAKFEVQLGDVGVGIDKSTVVPAAFQLLRNGTPLVEGADYSFNYLESSNRVVFEAAAIYPMGSYVISVVQAAVNGVPTNVITDLAGNPLLPNKIDGTTSFAIDLADAPAAPTGLAVVPGDGQAQLSWTAATSDGSALLRHEVQWAGDPSFTGATTTNVLPPNVSLTAAPLVNGTQYWFRVRGVNAVGESEWSTVIGPVVPLPIPTFALAADTGAAANDWVTSNPAVNVSGVIGGATWEFTLDGGATWTPGVGSSFMLALGGSYAVGSVRVRQTVSGTTSGAFSNPTAITVDATAPATPTFALTSDSGSSGSDGITSNGAMTVAGLEPGATWQFSTNGGTDWTTGTGTTFTLPAGVYVAGSVRVRQTDLAGNTSSQASNPAAVTVDASAPSAPSFGLTNDNGASASDGVTSDGSISVSGIEANAVWQYSTDGGTSWTNGAGTSFTLAAGTYPAGRVRVRQTDLAGNTSPERSNPAAITVDTSVAVPSFSLVSDTGSSNSDGVTQDGRIAVTGIEPGGRWEYSTNGGSSWTTGSGSTFTLPGGVYAAGSVRVRQTDLAGNQSGAAANAAPIEVDGVVASPSLALASDTGSSAADGVTRIGTVDVFGIEPRGTWQFTQNGGATWSTPRLSTVTTFNLPVGIYAAGSVRVRQTDLAGNASIEVGNPAQIVVDTTAPAVPAITGSLPSGSRTNLRTPTFSGSAEPGSVVTVASGSTVLGTVVADGAGNWALVAAALPDGRYDIVATASDLAGNSSPASTVYQITIDTVSPIAPAPTRLTARPGDGSVALVWTAPRLPVASMQIVDYVIEYRTAGGAWTRFADGQSSATTATVTGLANGTPYEFRVAAITTPGPMTGAYSLASSLVTPAARPAVPQQFVVQRTASRTVSASWAAPAAASGAGPVTGYVLQYRLTNSGLWTTVTLSATTTTRVVTRLRAGASYAFRVAAQNAAGVGSFTSERVVTA